jgi:hypothetical protein
MSHQIGTGTVNLSVNLPTDERAILGRLAFVRGESIGQFVRKLLLNGLAMESLTEAERVIEIRRQYYGSALLVIFCGALLCGGANEFRRAKTRVEEVREEVL